MIKGCSNGGCVVRGETGGQHTNGICRCVEAKFTEEGGHIYIQGVRVGNAIEWPHDWSQAATWLRKGGLRDILALERSEQNEELVELRKMVDDYQKWLEEAWSEIAKMATNKTWSVTASGGGPVEPMEIIS